MISAVYPEHEWVPWRFNQVSKGFWNNMENQKQTMAYVAKQLNIKDLNEWYGVTVSQVEKIAGSGLLNVYNNSLIKLLQSVYPEHPWQVWKFAQVPRGFWDSNENQREYLRVLQEQLNISKLSDWHSVS
jgi:hypothetical protein